MRKHRGKGSFSVNLLCFHNFNHLFYCLPQHFGIKCSTSVIQIMESLLTPHVTASTQSISITYFIYAPYFFVCVDSITLQGFTTTTVTFYHEK